ncbi:hypothetical protein HYH03_012700 [Edaphochlamys debaryana]|uniref:Uncharacterized protein n=1 Tax=Edaphochlamys debaryana TaxID=47281 RepID=A0A835XS66_9CHLO|nr:hypothetical protein HYH03_012700 [Edaphochlamys debaryana]|eukprot:KAG2488700.1 hypothetical protein HYH03_012700 [Edaphochlamys debaryana]
MGPVEQQKRELCKHAYLLIHKYLAAAGKEGVESFEFRKNLRKKDALDIDMATNKEVIAEVSKFKEQGGAAAMLAGGWADGMVATPAATGAAKATKSRGGASMGVGGASGLPPLGTAAGSRAGAAAKPSRSAAAKGGSKAEGMPPLSSLPPKIGLKINRWWAAEGRWFTAVATDYNAETNEYRLTYNLGSAQETYEDFNIDVADPAIYEVLTEKVNLLAKTGSAAVNNSVVLQPFLQRGGGGGNKKRRSSDDDWSDGDF